MATQVKHQPLIPDTSLPAYFSPQITLPKTFHRLQQSASGSSGFGIVLPLRKSVQSASETLKMPVAVRVSATTRNDWFNRSLNAIESFAQIPNEDHRSTLGPPSSDALNAARLALDLCQSIPVMPAHIAPTVDEGVAFSFLTAGGMVGFESMDDGTFVCRLVESDGKAQYSECETAVELSAFLYKVAELVVGSESGALVETGTGIGSAISG